MNFNPVWIRGMALVLLIPLLVSVGSGWTIPYWPVFALLALAFVVPIFLHDAGINGKTLLQGAGKWALVPIVFFTLWCVLGGSVGFYPIDVWELLGEDNLLSFLGKRGGGESYKVLLGVLFVLLLGGAGYAVAFGNKRGIWGVVLTLAAIVLMIRVGLPGYYGTWPSRKDVDTKLVESGGVGKATIGAVSSWLSSEDDSSEATTTAPAVVYVPAPAPPGPEPEPHPFDTATGCVELPLPAKVQWGPMGADGVAMRVYNPRGVSHVETLGAPFTAPASAFGPATWRFCAEGPRPAEGVWIWKK